MAAAPLEAREWSDQIWTRQSTAIALQRVYNEYMIQRRKYKDANTKTQIQRRKYKDANTMTQIQRHKYQIWTRQSTAIALQRVYNRNTQD